jgi:hypothetical protein
MMRTPLSGGDDDTRSSPGQASNPRRRVQLIAICVLTILAAVLALAAFGPQRLSGFLRADHAPAPKR